MPSSHASTSLHSIWHEKSGGHTTVSPPLQSVMLQSTMHVLPPGQPPVQSCGHGPPGGTGMSAQTSPPLPPPPMPPGAPPVPPVEVVLAPPSAPLPPGPCIDTVEPTSAPLPPPPTET